MKTKNLFSIVISFSLLTNTILCSNSFSLFKNAVAPNTVYAKESNSQLTLEYSEDSTVVSIPETLNGMPITYVNLPKTICNNSKIKKLILPSKISTIYSEDYIESEDMNLQYFNSLTPNCPKLSEIEVNPNNNLFKTIDGILYSKDGTTLYYCPPAKEGDLVIPEGVTEIGFSAFQNCSKLTSLTIPSSLQYIDKAAFGGNVKLKTLTVDSNNPYFKTISDVLFSFDGEILYTYPAGKINKNYNIPEMVFEIKQSAFSGNSNLANIIAPTTLQTVGTEAFENCKNLKTIKFNSSLLYIKAGAFLNCSNLEGIVLPYGTKSINEGAFIGCNKLLKLKLPSSIQLLPDNLGNVKNRKIFYYNPYYIGTISESSKLGKGLTTYAYKDSIAEVKLKSEGAIVKNINKKYSLSKPFSTTDSVIKGTGKPDTSWYNKKSKSFLISNPDQLAGLAQLVNKGTEFKGKGIKLAKDLDLSCYTNWIIIGKDPMKDGSPIYIFKGTFDGNNCTIYNLRINNIKKANLGLFGVLDGTIKNLNFKYTQIIGESNIGIVAGYSSGDIINCTTDGNLRGYRDIGGLVGESNGSISNCSSSATLHGNENLGGLVGEFYGSSLMNSNSDGYISGLYQVGGIVGEFRVGELKNCESYSLVKGRTCVGGIIGISKTHTSIISDCASYNSIIGTKDVGGLIGLLDGTVLQCSNYAAVIGDKNVGGLVGSTTSPIKESSNYGNVNGKSCVGGILGTLSSQHLSKNDIIIDCENFGTIDSINYSGNEIGRIK